MIKKLALNRYLTGGYGTKHGYVSRKNNNEYFDGTSFNEDIVYQPHVYKLARYLGDKISAEYIIDIGAGNGEKLSKNLANFKIIAIDCETNLNELRKNLPGQEILEHDLEKGLPKINKAIVEKSIVICSDVIEHIFDLNKFLKDLAAYSKVAPFVLISTPDREKVRGLDDQGPPANPAHVREWSMGELNTTLDLYGFFNLRTGHTINTNHHKDKTTILSISGAHSMPRSIRLPRLKTLAIMTAFNEEDIIEHSIQNLMNEGLDVHVIDNWSTDRTQQIIDRMAKQFSARITHEKFPNKPSNKYQWAKILDRVDQVAMGSKHDWIIHHDADEIRKSPHPSVNMADAITYIDYLGYNAIDHTVLDFRPTKDGYTNKQNPEEFFRYFEYGKRPGHFLQIKGWKNNNKLVGLSINGGHDINTPELRVYPMKFLLKHYPLRSKKQAVNKIFKDRKPRVLNAEAKKGWHIQYNGFDQETNYIWDESALKKFHAVTFWQEELVEQSSGIGINN